MARQSVGSLFLKFFGLACGFVYAVAVARLLGPTGYGMVAVAVSTATVFSTVAIFGINELAVREIAASTARKSWGRLRRFAGWSTRTALVVSLVTATMMAAVSFVPGPYSRVLLLASFLVPLFALMQVLRGITQGSGRVIFAQLPLDVVRWLITLLLIGALVLGPMSATPQVVILVVVLGLVVALMFSIATVRKLIREVPDEPHEHGAIDRWFVQALPFLAIALFGIIGTEIGTLLLGYLSGPTEAGLYQPIARLAPLMLIANEAIGAALAPRIVHSWEDKDWTVLQRRMSRSALASTLATTSIVAIIIVASPFILAAFGPDFLEYQYLVVWIGVAQVFNAAMGAAPLLLAMTGDIKSRISAQVVTMFVQVGLGVAIIPSWGAAGAVTALVAAILVWSLLHWWVALRVTGIDTMAFGFFSCRRSRA